MIVFCDEIQTIITAGMTENNPQSVIPFAKNKFIFEDVGLATNFWPSLAPCHSAMVARSRHKNLCCLLFKFMNLFFANGITQFLKEPIENTDIRLIGATTEIEYRKFVEIDPPFARRFQKIDIEEMAPPKCLEVLKHRLQMDTECYQGLNFTDEVLQTIIVLTSLLDSDVGQPDKDLTLIELVASYTWDSEDKTITQDHVAKIYSSKLQKQYKSMNSTLLLNLLKEYRRHDQNLDVLSAQRIQNHLQRIEESQMAREEAALMRFFQQQPVPSNHRNSDGEESS